MKSFFCTFILLLLNYFSINVSKLLAQTVIFETPLPKEINETSGLEFFNEDFLTFNDSGGEPALYQFSVHGDLLLKYPIEGAENNDWEDIAQDENYIFISDSGNNKGNRKNLNILILDPEDNFKKIEEISFNYGNQQNFKKRNKHPYDAEALVATEENLILFSKNRKDFTSEVFLLPKTVGKYTLIPEISLDVQSLITGADYHHKIRLVALVGYMKSGEQFLYTLNSFDVKNLDLMKLKKYKLPLDGKQIEAIKIIDQKTFWITSENEGIGFPTMYKIQL